MPEPWNSATVLPPPVTMFLCVTKFDLPALKNITNNIIKVLSKQSPLHKESAICSRFLYKYDKKFRNDIGYRNLRKVNTALKKYLALNLLKEIESFSSALPDAEDDDLYLPSRQMLQYVLLRIMAFAKIMVRVSICSKQAAVFYLDRVKRGESHWMSLLPYALLSRLWSMSMVLLQHSTTWYTNLYPFLNKLQMKGLDFLPNNYALPQDLDQWLDLKHIDEFGRFEWAQKKDIDVDNTLNDEDNDLLDNILDYVNQNNENEIESDHDEEIKPILVKTEEVPLPVPNITQIDHGVALSRESFKLLLNTSKSGKEEQGPPPPPKREKQHSYKSVTNSTTLKKFIEVEENFRNESDSKSLTSHLSLMQWHALKKSLLQLCDNPTNRKIDKKFNKIWKVKCLDYM
uniref:SFRICE_004721 n=1 Tax=Spodoptera frugiperda TaxID=7108 RepID=A0A2H1V7Q4_SPOFR